MPQHEFLSDVAAHREAHDVRAIDARRVEHRHRIVRHLRDRVGRRRHLAPADAAVVEHEGAKARRQRRANAIPPLERRPEPHD
jgi:hypothetical protein